MFIATFNAENGEFIQGIRDGGSNDEEPSNMSFEESGLLYVSGSFTENTVLGSGQSGEIEIIGEGEEDIFLAKYILSESVSIDKTVPVNRTIELFQNFPNPFTESTRISFSIEDASSTSIAVYDILGREVRNFFGQLCTRY